MPGSSERAALTGLKLKYVEDIKEGLKLATDAEIGFGFICTNVVPESMVTELLNEDMKVTGPFTWSDKALTTAQWQRGIVGMVSNLQSELNGADRKRSERAGKVFDQEMNVCFHLRIPAIVIELTQEPGPVANCLNTIMTARDRNTHAYWIKVAMMGKPDSTSPATKDPWKAWNTLRFLCKCEKLVHVALQLGADVPEPEADEVKRWLGEPVKALFINPDIFTTNDNGYPVLSKVHQNIIKQFMRLNVQVVLEAESFSEDLKYYNQYIYHLHQTMGDIQEQIDSGVQQFAKGYENVLQIPLQPLRDDLESSTYETFEKDPVKYNLYQHAIHQALLDKVPVEERNTTKLIVMVVGAGRGPLVQASLEAAEMAGVNIHVYAIEKNANAANSLYHVQKETKLWEHKVTIHCSDIRSLEGVEKADIIVSELLGSFGDNELSPECLDGAQLFLKEGGIMIPKNYTSFIAPIMSPTVHRDVWVAAEADKPKEKAYQVPYVILMNNKYDIADTQELFTFEHPTPDDYVSHDRYSVRKFESKLDCVLHGFTGFFESVLYGDIKMSIHPPTYSHGMFSWFPMFFPLMQPVQLFKSQDIVVHFWRKSSETEVWYEWTITSPYVMEIHNSNGHGNSMSLK